MASGWRHCVRGGETGYPVLGTEYRESSSQLLGGRSKERIDWEKNGWESGENELQRRREE